MAVPNGLPPGSSDPNSPYYQLYLNSLAQSAQAPAQQYAQSPAYNPAVTYNPTTGYGYAQPPAVATDPTQGNTGNNPTFSQNPNQPPASNAPAGTDPFAYTNGSLLTPWTQQFNPNQYTYPISGNGAQPGSTGSGGGSDEQSFLQNLLNQGVPPQAAADQLNQAFGLGYGTAAVFYPDTNTIGLPGFYMAGVGGTWTPVQRSGGSGGSAGGFGVPDMAPFQYGGAPLSYNFSGAGAVGAPAAFNYATAVPDATSALAQEPAFQTPSTLAAPAGFVAPTLDNTNDPGYAFRLQQAQQAIQNTASAQGVRGGDVEKALQDYAQNYASSEYGNVYNRAFGQYQNDVQNTQNTYQINTQTQLAAQQQGYEEVLNNYNAQLAAQQQGFSQSYNSSALNDQNQLQAASLTSQNINAANALGWDVAQGTYQANYNQALTQYQMAYQQAMYANTTDYSRAYQSYMDSYNMYNTNQNSQFSKLSTVAGLGANAASGANSAVGANAANNSNLITGAGNAGAAGIIGAGNAGSNLTSALGNDALVIGLNWPYNTTPPKATANPGSTSS